MPRASPSAKIMPDEKKDSAVAFLKAASTSYAGLGIARIMSAQKNAPFGSIERQHRPRGGIKSQMPMGRLG
jgi:hypothetical protein